MYYKQIMKLISYKILVHVLFDTSQEVKSEILPLGYHVGAK